MKINMKFVFFIFMLNIMSLESREEANFGVNLESFPKVLLNYIFPKNPGIIRVRKPEDVKTEQNNVAIMDFVGLVERHGYPAEEHYVTTEDGYNLVIHRIPGSPLSKKQSRKIVFIQHGIFALSDTWVLFGPGKDLAFLLADKGYDVWLGNFRGNSYSRLHIKMSPRDKDFWQFSVHEMGTKDLPAMIDYILNYTKQKTLFYIGHSMGSTALFILLSTKPEYNTKIELGICLAPIAIWKKIPPFLQFFGNDVSNIKEFLDVNEIYEVVSLSSTTITIGKSLCADEAITQPFCVAITFLIVGSDPAQLNTTALPEILSHFPAGCSVQTLHHFYQNIITHKFQAYDYGHAGNYKQYGQKTPITYDLKKVTAPLVFFYSANDMVSLKSNVLETYKHLPNIIMLEENPYKLLNHLDFLWAINAKTLIYDRVIELLQEFDN